MIYRDVAPKDVPKGSPDALVIASPEGRLLSRQVVDIGGVATDSQSWVSRFEKAGEYLTPLLKAKANDPRVQFSEAFEALEARQTERGADKYMAQSYGEWRFGKLEWGDAPQALGTGS